MAWKKFITDTGSPTLGENWDAGPWKITAETLESDVVTGTAPLVVASTTLVANLNATQINSLSSTALSLVDGTQAFSGTVGGVTPAADADLATKAYVDSVAAGLDAKGSCVCASTADLEANTYANGTLGVGATLTKDSFGAFPTTDGVTMVQGEQILVKDQTAQLENGIYTLTEIGNGGVAWILQRRTDNDELDEQKGAFTFIEEGTANADTGWVNTTDTEPVVMGTTALTWAQFSGAGSITAGDGLTKTANTIDVVGGTGITANANDIQITALGVDTAQLAASGVTYAKIQDVSATDRILGRDTAGAGVVEEIAEAGFKTMFNLTIGTDVQTQDATLDDISGIAGTVADNEIMVGTGAGTMAFEGGATARTSLGLAIGTDVQTQDAVLDDLSALTPVADNQVIVGTGAGTYAHEAATTLPATIGGVIQDLDTLGAATADGEFLVASAAGVFAYETGATARTSIGLGAADNVTFNNLSIDGELNTNAFATLTIATGSVTHSGAVNYTINGESASDDILVTIAGGAEGDVIYLQEGDANITIFHTAASTTDTIRTQDAANFVMTDDEIVHLVRAGTQWQVVAGGFATAASAGVTTFEGRSGTVVAVAGDYDETLGGTGQTTFTTGDLIQSDSANSLAKLAAVATGNALISGGVTTASSWGKVGLTTHVSGTLPVTSGGIGIATVTANDMLYASGADTLAVLTPGNNEVLSTNGSGVPSFDPTLPASLNIPSPVLTTPQINDTSLDHQYVFAVSELTLDRTVTLPLLTGNDEFVFASHAVTMTDKTLTTNTILTEPALQLADTAFTGTPAVGTLRYNAGEVAFYSA